MESGERGGYIKLQDLEIYRLAREMSDVGWGVYNSLAWQDKKVIGDQFIRAIDSVGANIAEGYGRFHFLDRIKFCYNARGSLIEAIDHWLELMKTRKQVKEEDYNKLKKLNEKLSLKLNNFISATYRAKNETKQ